MSCLAAFLRPAAPCPAPPSRGTPRGRRGAWRVPVCLRRHHPRTSAWLMAVAPVFPQCLVVGSCGTSGESCSLLRWSYRLIAFLSRIHTHLSACDPRLRPPTQARLRSAAGSGFRKARGPGEGSCRCSRRLAVGGYLGDVASSQVKQERKLLGASDTKHSVRPVWNPA